MFKFNPVIGLLFKVQLFLLSVCYLFIGSLPAQVRVLGSPIIRNFSQSEYQAGTQNWAIGQDGQGLMYFGNNKGLLEFDGTNWVVYPLPNHTIVRSIAFDPQGRLLVGGQSEFGYFAPDEYGAFTYHSLSSLLPEDATSFEDVWGIYIRDALVYFCSEKVVFIWDGKQVHEMVPPGDRFENFFYVAGDLFFQDKTEGLYRITEGTIAEPIDTGTLFDERVVSMLPLGANRILVSTLSEGLHIIENGKTRQWLTDASVFASTHLAYCATLLSNGNVAMGTSQNGLVVFDPEGNIVLHINRENGLANNTVLSVFQDGQSNVWMGLDNGIGYAEIMSPFSLIGEELGVTGTGYTSAWFEGKLYLGTNQGLTAAPWNGNGDKPAAFELVENGVGQVWNLNNLGNNLIVSQHKGASFVQGERLKGFSDIAGAWKFYELRSQPGYALEGTYGGLVVYKHDDSVVSNWTFVKMLDGFTESARVFEEDSDGHIWVSHAYKGLFRLSLTDNADSISEIRSYSESEGLPTSLFINVVRIRNELVFTTPKGIFRYNNDEDRFEEHPDFKEIFGAGRDVHRLLQDEMGNIWFSIDGEFGLVEVDDSGIFANIKISYFNHLQGALVDGFEHVYAHDASNVIIGAENGFIHYNPLASLPRTFPFLALIRNVISITHSDSTIYRGRSVSSSSDPPSFKAKLNDFRFDFCAPYYEENNHIEYRYKLDGFDGDWSHWTAKTEKEYTNLPQGNYKFKVQARNAYGDLSEEASFAFGIDPHWYASIYAKVGYVVLLFAMVFLLINYFLTREARKTDIVKQEQAEALRQKEEEFKKEVEKSEGELVAMRNEKLTADIKHKTSQLASATMHLVQKSEMLAKLKTDLNQLSENASGNIKQQIKQVTRTIESDIQLDNNWDQFETYFDQVHENFFKRLREKFPELTPKDQKLCAYLRMNLSTKEIAPLLNISVRGVEISRYRVRKKLQIDTDTNLVAFIMDI